MKSKTYNKIIQKSFNKNKLSNLKYKLDHNKNKHKLNQQKIIIINKTKLVNRLNKKQVFNLGYLNMKIYLIIKSANN